jgi:hypothetical protein
MIGRAGRLSGFGGRVVGFIGLQMSFFGFFLGLQVNFKHSAHISPYHNFGLFGAFLGHFKAKSTIICCWAY